MIKITISNSCGEIEYYILTKQGIEQTCVNDTDWYINDDQYIILLDNTMFPMNYLALRKFAIKIMTYLIGTSEASDKFTIEFD